jgi:ATP-dependent exoDNAse (exonuclease V) alpha subunit
MIKTKLNGRVRIVAPTNKAGLNIGGGTIHRFLELDKNGYIKQALIKMIKMKYDYIIVDEISMIDKDLWRRLCLLKQELPELIFLLLGDEKQLSPVEENTIKDYFHHPAVKYICNYNKNILNVRKRYDEILYNLLEDVDNIDITKYPKLITDRNICYYNKTRIRINKMWNDRNKKEGDLFLSKPIARLTRNGDINQDDEKYFKQTQDMYLYEGLPVIAMRTLFDKESNLLFANSETFNICFIGDEEIGLYNERPDENGNKEGYNISIPIEDFNKYFLMNYCSTTHKTQGETITENFTIYDWDAMDTKLRYTALSRAKKIEQVYINH